MWTCGVDRFSQCVKKFESKAMLLQTSALSELRLSSAAEAAVWPALTDVDFSRTYLSCRFGLIIPERERTLARPLCLCQWEEATPFSISNFSPPSQRSARCPLTDTNTNIIPTRGGNSFLTWMIKIFF